LFEGDSILLGTLSDWDVVSLGYFKVDSIGTKSTIKGNRRAIYLKGPPNEWGYSEHPVWVEGIGTIGNLLYRIGTPHVNNGELGCFFKDGDLIYKSSLAIKHDTCLLYSTGTNEITCDDPVTFYPNPFTHQLTIDYLPNEYLLIEIYNIYGRLAYSQNTHSSPTHSINTGHLNTSLYLIRIRNPETGKALANRIVIKK